MLDRATPRGFAPRPHQLRASSVLRLAEVQRPRSETTPPGPVADPRRPHASSFQRLAEVPWRGRTWDFRSQNSPIPPSVTRQIYCSWFMLLTVLLTSHSC